MIADPPLEAGAAQETLTWAFPIEVDTACGTEGTVTGVTAFDGDDEALVPAALVAVTLRV